MIISKNERE